MRDVDPPDERTPGERVNDWLDDNREVPDCDEVRDFVMRRIAREDMEPTADEVLRFLERRAFLTV